MRCCLLLLLFPLLAYSQAPVEFFRLGVNEGLSQNSVYAIHQDKQGFLWIGTGDGLNRYDGKSFKIFRERWNDTSARNMPGRIVNTAIVEDREQRLWFATNLGLTVFDTRTEKFFQPATFSPQIKKANSQFVPIGCSGKDEIWLRSGNDFFSMNTRNWMLTKAAITQKEIVYAECVNNAVYFITPNAFFKYAPQKQTTVLLKKLNGGFRLQAMANDLLCVQDKNSIYLYNWKTGQTETLPASVDNRIRFSEKTPTLLHASADGVLYLRDTKNGIVLYDRKTGAYQKHKHEPGNPSSLSNNYIINSFVDQSKNLWLGTEGGGLSRIDLKPKKFKSFPAYSVNAQQASNLMVKSIYEERGKILIGTFEQGIYLVNKSNGSYRHLAPPQFNKLVMPNSTNFFYKDHRGRLWSNIGRVVGWFDTANFRFKQSAFIEFPFSDASGNFTAYCMAEYAPDQFLIGTFYGLVRLDANGGQLRVYRHPADSVFNGYIQSISVAADGSIYLGKIRNGFWHLRKKGADLQVVHKDFLNIGVRSFYAEPRRSIVWVGSESGLIAYNPATGRSRVFDAGDGMGNDYVYAVLPQDDSTLWLSTNKGLIKAAVQYTGKDSIANIRFNNYTQVDGLQSNEFNTGAYHKSGNGDLFFGGVNGINWFHPTEVITNRHQPRVVLTHFKVNEKEYETGTALNYLRSLELNHTSNTLDFRFASLDYTNPAANSYAYRLKGFDKQWIQNGSFNEARYANLPPGRYEFCVRGSNSDGVWSEETALLSILIHPPFWATPWFRVLMVLTLIVATGLAVRFYVRLQIRNRLKELEKQQAVNEERLRISKDMHDELGTGLTKIALLTEVTRRSLTKADAGNSLPLEEITSTSRELTQKMGEIIWTLNPGNDSLDNLTAYLKEQLSELSETAGIRLHTSLPETIPELNITNRQRQQLLLVTKEAFHNILKHAQATEVWWQMEVQGEQLFFSLEDNGIGLKKEAAIQPSSNGKKNGLNNMAARMESIGGWFAISNRSEGGTRVKYGFG